MDKNHLKQLAEIRKELAQEHNWAAQEQHYVENQKHWKAQRVYWWILGIAAVIAVLINGLKSLWGGS